jgi:hypothetical protein
LSSLTANAKAQAAKKHCGAEQRPALLIKTKSDCNQSAQSIKSGQR